MAEAKAGRNYWRTDEERDNGIVVDRPMERIQNEKEREKGKEKEREMERGRERLIKMLRLLCSIIHRNIFMLFGCSQSVTE